MEQHTLTLRKRQRQAAILNCNKEITKAQGLGDPENVADVKVLQTIVGKLSDYRTQLSNFNDQILITIVDDDEAVAAVQKASDIDDKIVEVTALLSAKLENYSTPVGARPATPADANTSNHSFGGDHRTASVRLPKLEIAKYHGDPLKFQEFWDTFSTTIHDSNDLSTIDKFKYLRSFLGGDAFRLIDGYRLTAENYESAVDTLKERFGDKQLAIFAHFEAMLELPVVTHDTHQLQSTYDDCERHIRSLIALGLAEETFGQVFTPIILSKLPLFVKMELHRRNGSKVWTLQVLRDLLKDEIRARDMSHRTFGGSGDRNHPKNSFEKHPPDRIAGRSTNQYGGRGRFPPGSSTSLVASAPGARVVCHYCRQGHYSDRCTRFPDVQSRKANIKGHCFVCLEKGHMASNCPSVRTCVYCKKSSHHRSLCHAKFGGQYSTTDMSPPVNSAATGANRIPVNSTNMLSHGDQVVLQTALVNVRGSNGGPGSRARLLFDTGCSRTFITSQLAETIKARPLGDEVISVAGFKAAGPTTESYKVVEFDVILADGSGKTLTVNVSPTITCPVQKIGLDAQKYPVIKQLMLAEPLVNKTQMICIDVLIGSDYYYDFIGCERVQCSDGLIFVSSSLGFIASGRVRGPNTAVNNAAALVCARSHPSDSAHFNVERFWSLEDIGVKPPTAVTDDEEAMHIFKNTVEYKDGRYHVSWPWKSDAPDLPDHYYLALGRLKSLLRRLGLDGRVVKQYDETIQQQLERGIIERAPQQPTGEPVHYIPHHCVITPSKATTKLRVVYDASAKSTKASASINELLHRGPVMLDDLCGLLMRFRLSPIAMVSDIEKAFLQVGLLETSRDATRFLWVADPKLPPIGNNLIVFRFCRVPFGYISSPFLLAAVLQHHFDKSGMSVAADMNGNVYVDNVIVGKSTVSDAKQFYDDAKAMLKQASMNLREWFTNSVGLNEYFPPEDRGIGDVTKVLGLNWDTKRDTLSCGSFTVQSEAVNTKRLALKYLAKVFDPCGFFAPVTVVGKILIQKLWSESYGWDNRLPDELSDEWRRCSEQLQQISSCEIPRCVVLQPTGIDVVFELHCFVDASAKAYAASLYLKSSTATSATTDLIFAKSRVAPLKSMTIPRLELMAMLVGTRLMSFTEKNLRLPIAAKYVWSDSQCVLHWTQKKSIPSTFVKNRISEIKSHDGILFRYVPTKMNPADLSTRGCSCESLVANTLWWKGPPWLLGDCSEWPNDIERTDREQAVVDQDDDGNDGKNDQTVLVINDSDNVAVFPAERFSSYSRLLRVTSWIHRFVNNARKSVVRSGNLSVDEVAESRRYWELRIQQEHFAGILTRVGDNIIEGIAKQLNLFIDDVGLLRCGGRLAYAELPVASQCPILMPKNCHFTDLVIRDCHNRLYHAGVAQTLAQLRYIYWVVHGRSQVKRVVRTCFVCKVARGGSYPIPPEPQLPEFRVRQLRPFSSVGIDYMGPLFVRDSPGNYSKVWIALFTCTVVRAIHLEVVEQLSTEELMMALRRFVAVRGLPTLIISDNAKQFQAANRTLLKVWRDAHRNDAVSQFSVDNGIRWKFITEFSPWMGGFYERMVGLTKSALKKSLDTKCVSLSELRTATAEIAATINCRPLVYSESEPSDPPLTPAHFIGGAHSQMPQFDFNEDAYLTQPTKADDLIFEWKRIQSTLNKFWDIWRSQYLLSLRATSASVKHRNVVDIAPVIGGVVLVKDNLPRNMWKLGVVTELLLSGDGVCRSVSLRLSNRKTIRRPIRLLFPMEFDSCGENIDATIGDLAPTPNATVPRRPAAVDAATRIQKQLRDELSDCSEDN